MTILHAMLSLVWLDLAVGWLFTWPHWAAWLLIGWVVYAIMLHQRKVNAQNYRATLVTALTLWPIGLLLMCLEWAHLFAAWLGSPAGPFAGFAATFRNAFSRWSLTKE